MNICVDIDGVICEYDFPKIVKKYFGVNLPADSIYAYDLADVLGVSPDDIDDMFREQVWGKPEFVEGALEVLEEWRSEGYLIDILTNRLKYMDYRQLENWLARYSVPYLYICPSFALPENPDYHIDDSPAKLMKVNAKTKLLFNQPWNERCLDITGELRRVHNWQEIREIVG
jgi:uncharacterized HAD superfamily protein